MQGANLFETKSGLIMKAPRRGFIPLLTSIKPSGLNSKGFGSRAVMQHQSCSLNTRHASLSSPAKRTITKYLSAFSFFYFLFSFSDVSP